MYDERVTGTGDDAETRAAAQPEIHRARLTSASVEIVEGPDKGRRASLGPSGLAVGSGSGCDLRLADPLVSRTHLEIAPQPDGVRIVDAGSRNGTFFQGARLREAIFFEDALVRLGNTTLLLRVASEPLSVPLSARTSFGSAIGRSRAMRYVFAVLEQAAKTQVTVLLEGESGTGKDLLAHALHEESPRRAGPFVVVDCGAIQPNLVESELFGHERGAFTGANATRAGAFELAQGGTVFLDEIGELPIDLQPKLLRVLESRSFRRVGGDRTIEVDVRVVAATNRRLGEAVRERRFREDLYYRLSVVHVVVPRLVDRPEDLVPIAEGFLRKATGDPAAELPAELSNLVRAYHWPGNARELRNVIERFATFGRTDAVMLFDRQGSGARDGSAIDTSQLTGLPYHEAKRRLVDAFHAAVIPRVVEQAGGNVTRAAEVLGIPRASIYRMLKGARAEGGDDPE
jgi:transcriptional regulator with PAS, ATPase and Fis domain